MKFKSDFLNEINARGFIYQGIDIENLDKIILKNKISGYIGFDITSDSLHVGSLIQLMLLHWLDFYGHQSIALVGGGTTLIGDPSGKDKTRKILTKNQIDKNINNIEKTFNRFINQNKNSLIINNYDWLSNLNYIDFLREFGSKITLNKMLTFESVKSRLDREQPLIILEFNSMSSSTNKTQLCFTSCAASSLVANPNPPFKFWSQQVHSNILSLCILKYW